MTGHLVAHVFRRGVEAVSKKEAYLARLEQDAANGGEVTTAQLLPIIIVGLLAFLVIGSIDYTIGNVIASLAIIESPSHTVVLDQKPPPYADEPDAPSDSKDLLLPAEAEADVDLEVTVIERKPVTAKITTAMGLLQRVGGFRSRWRGLGLSIFYYTLHSTLANVLASVLDFGLIGELVCGLAVSVGLSRVHMAWTHKMISTPTNDWWFRHLPPRKDCRVLLLPNLVYAAAQQATLLLPIGVAIALGVNDPNFGRMEDGGVQPGCVELVGMFARLLAVPVTCLAVALVVLFPASVTLTRIEAALLPENRSTIVAFDKTALMSDIDLSTGRGRRSLFVQAWRSFDGASRKRLIKLYAKMYLAEFTIALVAMHVMVAEVFIMGSDEMAACLKGLRARFQLMAIEHQQGSQ